MNIKTITTIYLILLLGISNLFAQSGDSIGLPENPQVFIDEQMADFKAVAIADTLLRKGILLRDAKKLKASIEYLNKALQIGEEEQNPRIRFLAINNIGLCYFVSSEYAKALDYFLEAFEIAIRDLPARYEQTILNNIALVYNADGKQEKALHFLKKAYLNAIDLGMDKKAAYYGINLATLYNDLGKYDTARIMLQSAIKFTEPASDNFYLAHISLAESYELAGDLEQSRQILQEIALLDTILNPSVQAFVFNRLAKVLHAQGRNKPAMKAALKGAMISEENKDFQSIFDSYTLLSDISKVEGNYGDAYGYLQKTIALNDTIQSLKNQEKLSELQARFELSTFEKELESAQERYKSLQKFNLIIIATVILVGMLIAYTMRVRWINMRQKNALLQKKEEIAALELEKSHAQQLLLEEELKQNEERTVMQEKLFREEIEAKNREISSKALINATKNDTIIQVIDQIDKINGNGDRYIMALKRELKSTIDIEEDWNDFVVHFEQIHDGFFKRLQEKHPDLNNNELRLIAYLRINLGGKEIARLFNITPASYRKRKMRLKEKLGLERPENLETYICNL
ncbi:MAG: tetratricopeptide repeat protein [Bacteroidales bacterium]